MTSGGHEDPSWHDGGMEPGQGTPLGRHRRRSVTPSDPAHLEVPDLVTGLLGGPFDRPGREISGEAGVSVLSARRFWRALGFPIVGPEAEVFGTADGFALRQMVGLVRDGHLDETAALAMTRAIARSTDRLAVWQAQLMAESIEGEPVGVATGDSRAVPDLATAEAAARAMLTIVDELEPVVIYAWRRHLLDALSRMIADAGGDEEAAGESGPRVRRCIGFADLVNFTSLVRRLSERQLASVVQRFEALATNVVTAHGGRVIKTVGDEVLFVTTSAPPAAGIALDLVDAMSEDDVLPEVRVGMASGPVVSRLGDVFGTTVNRASRLTAVALPSAVLVDAPFAEELLERPGFTTVPQRKRVLRGVGPVHPYLLRRSGSAATSARASRLLRAELADDMGPATASQRITAASPNEEPT